MKNSEYGKATDKTRIETCKLLKVLCSQLKDVIDTISDIEQTLYNEEYEE